jgi:hypothetical protein
VNGAGLLVEAAMMHFGHEGSRDMREEKGNSRCSHYNLGKRVRSKAASGEAALPLCRFQFSGGSGPAGGLHEPDYLRYLRRPLP